MFKIKWRPTFAPFYRVSWKIKTFVSLIYRGSTLYKFYNCTNRKYYYVLKALHEIKWKEEQYTLKHKDSFGKYRNLLTTLIRLSRKLYYSSKLDSNNGNLSKVWQTIWKPSENLSNIFFAEILVFDHDYEGKSSSSNGLLWISFFNIFF